MINDYNDIIIIFKEWPEFRNSSKTIAGSKWLTAAQNTLSCSYLWLAEAPVAVEQHSQRGFFNWPYRQFC